MSGLARWLPASCSRLSVFVCYAHEDRALAEEIAQALTNDGHDVFIDASKLKVSGDFNEDIRRAIEAADRFIFLISRASMAQGKYPQTELGFAQQRWPSPEGAVWPVLVEAGIDVARLPVYLRSVQIHRVKGNAPAEIAAEIEHSRTVRPRIFAGLAAAVALAFGVAGAWIAAGREAGSFAMVRAEQVDFRPSKKPGPDAGWPDSWLALTLLPVQYANKGSTQARIMDETVTLAVGERRVAFKWYNEVELKPVCAGPDFLCTKGSIGIQVLKPQDVVRRETMYTPAPGETFSWRNFVDFVCTSTAGTLEVSLTAQIEGGSVFGAAQRPLSSICRVDLKDVRTRLLGCGTPTAQMVSRASPDCQPDAVPAAAGAATLVAK